MHACGHDAHVAIALAVTKQMSADRDQLSGALKFVFQPAEEGGNGALAMIEDGVLDDPEVTAAVGLHVWDNLPVGKVGIYAGAMNSTQAPRSISSPILQHAGSKLKLELWTEDWKVQSSACRLLTREAS